MDEKKGAGQDHCNNNSMYRYRRAAASVVRGAASRSQAGYWVNINSIAARQLDDPKNTFLSLIQHFCWRLTYRVHLHLVLTKHQPNHAVPCHQRHKSSMALMSHRTPAELPDRHLEVHLIVSQENADLYMLRIGSHLKLSCTEVLLA